MIKIKVKLQSIFKSLVHTFDIQDFIFLLGFAAFEYGLYLIHPAPCFVIGGTILMVVSFLLRSPRGSN